MNCNGTESKLTDCQASHVHNCQHYEDAGVTCCEGPGKNQLAVKDHAGKNHLAILTPKLYMHMYAQISCYYIVCKLFFRSPVLQQH